MTENRADDRELTKIAASTTITCTKSEFEARLEEEFEGLLTGAVDNVDEVHEVIFDLVREADRQSGTFTGHSTYLDLDFTVTPDEDPRNPATVHFQGVDGETMCGMIPRDLDGTHHRAISYDDGDSTCTRCNTYVQQTIDDATTEAPKCEHCHEDDPLNLHLLGCIADEERHDLRICCTTYQTEAHEPGCTRKAPDTNADEITIPAVTGAQRDQAHRAAYDTAHNVGTELLSDVMVMALSPDRLDQLASALSAAAGHLRIAEQR